MQATGRLRVRVYTSAVKIPLEGAAVVVTRSSRTGKYELLSVQMTNREGEIRAIEIPAADLHEGDGPAGEGRGQSECQIWVEHPGYAMLRVEDVGLLPDEERVQELELTPLGEGQSSLQQRDVRPF